MRILPEDHDHYGFTPVLEKTENLILSERTTKALLAHEIYCLGQILVLTKKEIKAIPGIGYEGFREILNMVDDGYGAEVGIHCSNKDELATARGVQKFFGINEDDFKRKLGGNTVHHAQTSSYKNSIVLNSIDDLGLSKRTRNILVKNGVHYVGQLIVLKESDLFKFSQLKRQSVYEVEEVLQYAGNLGLGVPCGVELKTLDDIKAFFCLDESHPSFVHEDELGIFVSIPKSTYDAVGDNRIVKAIRGTCQTAFESAVLSKVAECFKKDIEDTSEAEMAIAKASFPSEKVRIVRVPLKHEASLTSLFRTESIQKIARDLDGEVLYPQIQSALDQLSTESPSLQ